MELPLFPLHTVLFPGCRLDLQIFEPRYLDMISDCLRKEVPFGVLAILEGEETGAAPDAVAPFGCEARIIDWVRRDNGLLGVRVEGGRRFRLNGHRVQDDRLSVGDVEWLPEADEGSIDPLHDDLTALYRALAQHPMVAALDMTGEPAGQQDLSYRLAYLLRFTAAQKIDLLAEGDPEIRLDRVQYLLEGLQGETLA